MPPFAARPWTYWFIMDGNLSREGITADFEAIHRAGLGGVILMEVDVGIPRGPVPFLSEAWRELFAHAVREAERLGLQITLNAGPGWTGSGGPWIPPDRSMQHLVASETTVSGPARFSAVLPQPSPRKPFFGEGALPPALEEARKRFYQDVAVLAFPTPVGGRRLAEIDEKALYTRAPYSSQAGVKPYLPAPAEHPVWAASECVDPEKVLDLTDRLTAEGRLEWDVPAGDWTILRMGRTSTGQNTRPAPQAGVGLESDKFDPAALELHFEAFVGSLLKTLGPRSIEDRGWTMLHIDSWEMSSQNWSPGLRAAFRQRRGYDLWRYLPVFTGRAVESVEVSERFLWDLRQTAQELVIEHHAGHLKTLGRRHGFGLSIEPYDMNPTADLSLGGVADVPMCEFWAKGYGFDTEFTCFEATSIAHTLGRPIVAAEAFTAADGERWRLYPGAMKAQGDWALATGINRIVFHRYQHQPWQDRWPGMTMGPYGGALGTDADLVGVGAGLPRVSGALPVPAASRVARGGYLLSGGGGRAARVPPPAVGAAGRDAGSAGLQLRRVRAGGVGRADGGAGRSADPASRDELPRAGVAGPGHDDPRVAAQGEGTGGGRRHRHRRAPRKSPSLAGYPACDVEVRALADELWGGGEAPPRLTGRSHGLGRVFWGGPVRGASARVQRPTSPLAEARWIWHREGRPATAAPVGRRFFRRDLALEDVAGIEMARLAITADNSFTVWVNGVRVGEGDNFHRTFTFDVGPLLLVGANRFAVAAENGGDAPNPAGWIGALEVRWRDGRTVHLATDASWVSALAVADGWQRQSARTPDWLPVLELGPLEMGPWNKPKAEAQAPELYPDYAVAAEVLAGLGVPPDLEADAPLRYTHRRDGDVDLYFVANPEAVPLVVNATFRVSGKQPELWDAITGTQRALPEYLERHGRVTVPLRFAPHQSWFVVFREPVKGTPQEERNFAERSGVADLTGPWEVHFQPGRGAPDRLAADALFDWAQHPEPGVRHFSGLATYRTEFEWRPEGDGRWAKSEGESAKSRVFLDLGRVEVMAQVRLNEQDLGVVWTAPWAVDVTEALRPGVNRLEVTVANLWPNRLIGDAALPADQRVTWTTWNPFTKDSPLLPSGLLGPVTLQREVPRWKVLVLIYSQTDFAFTNENGAVHLVAQMTPEERERAVRQAQRFFDDDVPALTGGLQRPVTTIRFPLRPLTRLEEGHGYWPGWDIVAPDVEPRFDSIVVLWKGTGTNVLNGQPLTVADAGGLALPRGTEPTYCAVPVEYLSAEHRNVFKHEWGHSLLFYFEAAGTAPKPAVDNHINDTDTRYVHWPTGESYVLEDETDARPIPNSIYHNASGFTRDYYRGETATPDQPRRRLGLTPQAWAAGGPVTKHAAASDAPASVQPVGLRCESRSNRWASTPRSRACRGNSKASRAVPARVAIRCWWLRPPSGWRGTRRISGTAAGWRRTRQLMSVTSAGRCVRRRRSVGRSGCGTRKVVGRNGPVRPLGRWVCCARRIGRRNGSGPPLDEALDFAGASWIWHAEPAWTDPASEVRPPRVASGVERWFETRFSWTAGKAVSQARLLATIDNGGEVWMNGQRVADVEAWETASAADVSAWLEPGTNRIVVRAHNGGTTPNPAGVLLKLVLRTKAGDVQTVVSDGSWHSASHTTGEGATVSSPARCRPSWWLRGAGVNGSGGCDCRPRAGCRSSARTSPCRSPCSARWCMCPGWDITTCSWTDERSATISSIPRGRPTRRPCIIPPST
ncbi:MAG: glycosyl hydrolase [Verrucomicrobia bacterium]|nr:glycosyl hydrolase [Verrucomicrobiota bacterium]